MHTGDLVQWYFDFETTEFDTSNKLTKGHRFEFLPKYETDRNHPKTIKYNGQRLYQSPKYLPSCLLFGGFQKDLPRIAHAPSAVVCVFITAGHYKAQAVCVTAAPLTTQSAEQ